MTLYDDLAAARARGTPTAWRRPAGVVPVGSADVFAWLLAAADNFAHRRVRLRVYAGERAETVGAEHHPRAEDVTIAGWLRRLAAHSGECGVVVNDLQAACPDAWWFMRRVLAGIFAATGFPPAGASLELFAGAYHRGFFGVHKDDQDVVTFVLEGRKRFLLWPFEYFAGRPDFPSGGGERGHIFTNLDPGPHRADALVLEGGPGDLLFWPAEWWHLAEGDGAHATSLGLGLFRGATAWRFVEQAVAALIHDTPDLAARALPDPSGARGQAAETLDAVHDAVAACLTHPDLRARVEERTLAVTSACGCNTVPLPRTDELPATLPVRCAAPGAIQWASRGDGTLLWAASGEVFRYPDIPPLRALLARVADGAPFVPGELAGRLVDPSIEADALLHVLRRMHAHHALIPAANPGAERT